MRRPFRRRVGWPDAAGAAPLLEPPGFLFVNRGRHAMEAAILAYVAYGAIVGAGISLAG